MYAYIFTFECNNKYKETGGRDFVAKTLSQWVGKNLLILMNGHFLYFTIHCYSYRYTVFREDPAKKEIDK